MVSWFYSILSNFTHNGELVLLTITALVYSPLRVSVDARFTQYFVLFLLGFFCSVWRADIFPVQTSHSVNKIYIFHCKRSAHIFIHRIRSPITLPIGVIRTVTTLLGVGQDSTAKKPNFRPIGTRRSPRSALA